MVPAQKMVGPINRKLLADDLAIKDQHGSLDPTTRLNQIDQDHLRQAPPPLVTYTVSKIHLRSVLIWNDTSIMFVTRNVIAYALCQQQHVGDVTGGQNDTPADKPQAGDVFVTKCDVSI